jgi:hypothetical protein
MLMFPSLAFACRLLIQNLGRSEVRYGHRKGGTGLCIGDHFDAATVMIDYLSGNEQTSSNVQEQPQDNPLPQALNGRCPNQEQLSHGQSSSRCF